MSIGATINTHGRRHIELAAKAPTGVIVLRQPSRPDIFAFLKAGQCQIWPLAVRRQEAARRAGRTRRSSKGGWLSADQHRALPSRCAEADPGTRRQSAQSH